MVQPAGSRDVIVIAIGIIASIASVVWFFRAPNKGVDALPEVLGRREGCLVCHLPLEGLSKAHSPSAIGCSSCHLGNPFSMDKERAHDGMVVVPGNLADVAFTCGNLRCHPVLARDIHSSLMATGRGMVSVNRFVFGEKDSPDSDGHLSYLGDSPAQDHLRKLCASCHLAKKKTSPAPISERSRGGGCTACHLSYSKEAETALELYRQKGQLPGHHPSLTIQVSRRHCFGCHSRSARISTNYEGWHETELSPAELAGSSSYQILEDGRVFVRLNPDIHFQRGMECIDCHTWREAMGDGKSHYHQEDQVEISCKDCHPTSPPRTVGLEKLDQIEVKILEQRDFLKKIKTFILASKSGRPLLNVTLDKGGNVLVIGKNSGKLYRPKPPPTICTDAVYGHQRLTCQSCHTPSAPTCIKCHTYFDKEGRAVDHLSGKKLKGRWVEQRGELLARQPALGIRISHGTERVGTFIPGMILTIDLSEYPSALPGQAAKVFRRLYAPTSAHTSSHKGLECQACHLNGLALGLGEGLFHIRGVEGHTTISFSPLFATMPQDGLPRDAWTCFLGTRKGMVSTRKGARPFSRREQQRIVRVGLCLTCHPYTPESMKSIYKNFPSALARMTPQCRLPAGFSTSAETESN